MSGIDLTKTKDYDIIISVAMPYKIGSYRGGAKWDEVEELILRAFNGYDVALYKL